MWCWPSNLKIEAIFSHVLGNSHTNFQQFPILWGFGRNFWTKNSTFIIVKSGNLCLRIPPEAPFYWKLLRELAYVVPRTWEKMASIFKFEGQHLPLVFRAVLYHTQASGQTLLGRSVCYVHCTTILQKFRNYSNLDDKGFLFNYINTNPSLLDTIISKV